MSLTTTPGTGPVPPHRAPRRSSENPARVLRRIMAETGQKLSAQDDLWLRTWEDYCDQPVDEAEARRRGLWRLALCALGVAAQLAVIWWVF